MFIGHTRFSLFTPDSSGWRASNGSRFTNADEYKAYLFADERLAPRFDIFLNYSLPLIEQASYGHHVRHIVSYSESLPGEHEAKLVAATAKYDFLMLDKQVDGKPSVTPLSVARSKGVQTGEAFATYRLDDDDLLPADYFDQISPYVKADNAGMMVSLGEGMTALYIDGQFYYPRKCYAPMIAIGLASICRFDEDGSLTQPGGIAHNYSDRKNPVILDSRKVGFMWTRHPAQDTSLGWGERPTEEMHEVIRKYMDHHPATTPEENLAAAFPTMAGKLHYQPGPTKDEAHA